VCYAYLADVPESHTPAELEGDTHRHTTSFSRSRWFTRGWTLQELIAPPELQFFSSTWQKIGDKSQVSTLIESITGIEQEILFSGDPSTASVGQRMRWASSRSTTRLEDIAYSLMGIFDVNMPMLYGEGDKAFLRLQEEIARTSDDQTLFTWRADTQSISAYRGPFARNPSEFSHCRTVVSSRTSKVSIPFTNTSAGFEAHFQLIPAGNHLEVISQQPQVRE
jgi:hypothetical protein